MSKNNNSTLTNIAQARATYAWKCAEKMKSDSKYSEYASLVRKIPMYIKTNGLLNTIAYLYSKKEVHHKVLEHIQNWLTHKEWGLISNQKEVKLEEAPKALIEHLTENSDNHHRLIAYTVEVLNLFIWLRRFVKTD